MLFVEWCRYLGHQCCSFDPFHCSLDSVLFFACSLIVEVFSRNVTNQSAKDTVFIQTYSGHVSCQEFKRGAFSRPELGCSPSNDAWSKSEALIPEIAKFCSNGEPSIVRGGYYCFKGVFKECVQQQILVSQGQAHGRQESISTHLPERERQRWLDGWLV